MRLGVERLAMQIASRTNAILAGARVSTAKASRPEVPPLGLELLSADVPSRVALAEDLHRGVGSRRPPLRHEPADADDKPRDQHPQNSSMKSIMTIPPAP